MNEKIIVKRLTVENFLSLDKVKVNFGKLTIFVGPNASGKSNIIKALTLLSGIGRADPLTNIQGICNRCLKVESIKQLFHDPNKELTIKVDLEVNGQSAFYDISFNSDGLINKEEVTHEKQLLTRPERGKTLYLHKETEVHIEAGLSDSIPAILYMPEYADPLISKMKDILGNIRTYSFDVDRIRSASSSGFDLSLLRDGSNLAQTLHSLLTYKRKRFLQIEDIMKQLIPEIEEINVPPTEDGEQVYLSIKEEGIPEPLKYHNISDGTLRILAFVTALYLESTIITFEEPENCVHPYLFETIVDLCRKAPVQVAITTHSPYLISKVADPSEILLIEKDKGKTKVRPVNDVEKVRRLLEEGLPLGEIWYIGELHGK